MTLEMTMTTPLPDIHLPGMPRPLEIGFLGPEAFGSVHFNELFKRLACLAY